MRIHFIGIGGIGVSALARYYLSRKDEVFGSDLAKSEITQGLTKIGARVFIGRHKAKNITKNTNLVVYSPAVAPDNPELKAAEKRGIECQSYPQALGELTKNNFTIAVAGTHGKGTTTAMISLILIKAGFDPTVIIGTKMKEFGDSNFRQGNSEYLVLEADEYQESFLNYWPKAIVLTTIDSDHLDYFKNLNNIIKAFKKFVGHLPEKGILVFNKDETNSRLASSLFKLKKSYSLKQPEVKILKKILKVPGEHIRADALAALALARSLKIPDKISFVALSEYKGAWRRFEEKTIKNYKIISDYGHHPTEIKATLKAIREKYPQKQIWCVFQPHQYQRTFYLFDDFVRALATAPVDKLILAPIYSVAGRESQAIKRKVSSAKLAKAVTKKTAHKDDRPGTLKEIFCLPTMKKIASCLKEKLKDKEILVVMGAGDIYKLPGLLEN